MTLALVAKITVEADALRHDRRLHDLAHDFLVARLEAARAAGTEALTFPLTSR